MRLKSTQVIALVNQKGGCGKTTSSINLAAALAQHGYSSALVDADSQCNATDGIGVNREELRKQRKQTIADVYLVGQPCSAVQVELGERLLGNLTVVAGHPGLESVSARLELELQAVVAENHNSELDTDDLRHEQRLRLRNSINSLRGEKDVVIIDTPPSLGFLMTTALIAADLYIVPIFPSGFELKGLENLARTTEKVKKRFNPNLELLGVQIGNFDASARLDGQIQDLLINQFGEEYVFDTKITRSVRHREATLNSTTIFEYAPGTQAAKQFLELGDELIKKLEKIGSGSHNMAEAVNG